MSLSHEHVGSKKQYLCICSPEQNYFLLFAMRYPVFLDFRVDNEIILFLANVMSISNQITCKVIFAVFFVYFIAFLLLNSEFHHSNFFAPIKQNYPLVIDQAALNVSSQWNNIRNLKTLNKAAFKTLNKPELNTFNTTDFKTLNENISQKIEINFSDSKSNFDISNYGNNLNLVMNKTRHRDVPQNNLKTILFWNDAYGSKIYSIGIGNEPFYTYKCPDTR
jgi:hypothetical protein